MMGELRLERSQDWLTIFFVLILAIICFLKKFFFFSFTQLKNLDAHLSLRQKDYLFNLSLLLIGGIVKVLIISFFFTYSPFYNIKYEVNLFRSFLFLGILFLALFLFKILLNQLVFYISFDKNSLFKNFYKIEAFYSWRFLLFSFPALILLSYSILPSNYLFFYLFFLYLYISVYRVFYLLKKVSLPLKVSFYYIIIYICSVELLPILSVFKYTINLK